MKAPSIREILDAREVAVIGASRDATRIGGRPIASMLRAGFAGRIYPINPNSPEVQGLRCYPDVAATGRGPDDPITLAIVATPAAQVEAAVRDASAAGVRAFVVFSAGFGELGGEGRVMQDRLSALARERGLAILGPNCLGLVNPRTGLVASFSTAFDTGMPPAGPFAFVGQSGALGSYFLSVWRETGLGLSTWISTGNEAATNVATAVEELIDDPGVGIIGMYVEDVKDGPALRRAAVRAAAAGKPLLVIKAGRSAIGARAAASHTGAIAGEDAAYEAFFAQHGIIRVRSLTEMVEVGRMLVLQGAPRSARVGVVSVSGGAGVLFADEAADVGLELPKLSEATVTALREALPQFATAQNPVDVTAQVLSDRPRLRRALEALAREPAFDTLVVLVGMMYSLADDVVSAVVDTLGTGPEPGARDGRKRVAMVWVSAPAAAVERLRAARIPVYGDIPPLIAAIAGPARAEAARARLAPAVADVDAAVPRRGETVSLSEWRARQRLAGADLPAPRSLLVTDDETLGAALAPGRLDFPLVAKLQSPALLHKTEHGAIALGLRDAAAARDAVARLQAAAQRLGVPLEGVLLQEMERFDVELLVGLRRDPVFGPVLALGTGGILVELVREVRLLFPPFDADRVVDTLAALRAGTLLAGFRGKPAIPLEIVAEPITRLAQFYLAHAGEIEEVEVNPLAVDLARRRVVALDALVVASD